MGEHLSQRAYARHRGELGMTGATHRAVHKAIDDGRLSKSLVRDAAGKVIGIIPEIADREWASNTTGSQNATQQQLSTAAALSHASRGNKLTAKGQAAAAGANKPPPAAPPADEPLTGGNAASYAQARAIKEAYEARLKKLEYDEKSGKLVPADKVKADCFKAGVIVREALLNIPSRLSAELASLTDNFEVERILRQEIHGILELCTREFARAGGIAEPV